MCVCMSARLRRAARWSSPGRATQVAMSSPNLEGIPLEIFDSASERGFGPIKFSLDVGHRRRGGRRRSGCPGGAARFRRRWGRPRYRCRESRRAEEVARPEWSRDERRRRAGVEPIAELLELGPNGRHDHGAHSDAAAQRLEARRSRFHSLAPAACVCAGIPSKV